MHDPDPKESWSQQDHLDMLEMLRNLIATTINSPSHIFTQHNKNAYLNHSWRIYNEYKRKYIK